MLSKSFMFLGLTVVAVSCANKNASIQLEHNSLLTALDPLVYFASNKELAECSVAVSEGFLKSLKDTIMFIPELGQYAVLSITTVTTSLVNRNVLAIQSLYSNDAKAKLAKIGESDINKASDVANFIVNSPDIATKLSKIAVEALQKKYSDFNNMPAKDKAELICALVGSVPLFVIGSEVALVGTTKSVSAIGTYSAKFIETKVHYLPQNLKYVDTTVLGESKDGLNVKGLPPPNFKEFKENIDAYLKVADTYQDYMRINKPNVSVTGHCANSAIALIHMLALNERTQPALVCAAPYRRTDETGSQENIINHLKSIKVIDNDYVIETYIEKYPAIKFSNSQKDNYLSALNSLLKERQMAYVFSSLEATKRADMIFGHATLAIKYGGQVYHIDNQIPNTISNNMLNVTRVSKFIDWIETKFPQRISYPKNQGFNFRFSIVPLNAFYNLN